MEIDIKLTKKQSVAWNYLTDNKTTTILFGGAAGSAKSFLGCLWVTTMCLSYPGSRYLIGRTRLTALKLTTVNTLLDLFKMMNFIADDHFKYNFQSNIITFKNGSEIVLKDLEYYPSDKDYDSLGSLELTGAFVDEAAQITETCYHILQSRIRYKMTEFNLTPKLLLTCNPAQNYLKRLFVIPYKDNTLPERMKFIPATAFDNPHLPPSYIETLKNLPEQQKQRLLMGSWDYTVEIGTMFYYDNILDSFHKRAMPTTGKYYGSLDVARFGEDKSILVISLETTIIEINVWEKLDTNQLLAKMKEKMIWYKIPPQHIIVDSDGVGGGITDLLRAKGFVNNASPLHGENFGNLKSQCYFLLSKKFKDGDISINVNNPEVMDSLIEELLAIRQKDPDKDGKLSVIPKEMMKIILGHSPDFADSIMMLMYFFIVTKSTGKYSVSILN